MKTFIYLSKSALFCGLVPNGINIWYFGKKLQDDFVRKFKMVIFVKFGEQKNCQTLKMLLHSSVLALAAGELQETITTILIEK